MSLRARWRSPAGLTRTEGVPPLTTRPATILGLSVGLSQFLDVGASDARLEQLARLTAARYWMSTDTDWARSTTFLFRRAGRYLYAVFPIYRARYYAVVRVPRGAIAPDVAPVSPGQFEIVVICVFEHDALKIVSQRIAEEP